MVKFAMRVPAETSQEMVWDDNPGPCFYRMAIRQCYRGSLRVFRVARVQHRIPSNKSIRTRFREL